MCNQRVISFILSAVMMAAAQVAAAEPGAIPTGSTFWPGYMGQQEGGASISPVQASLPSFDMAPPGPGVPSEQARWSGTWAGWMGRGKIIDVKVAVPAIEADKVAVIYASASGKIKPASSEVTGKFVGDELRAALPNGNIIAMRMVSPQRVEISYDGSASGGTCCAFGVLTKQP